MTNDPLSFIDEAPATETLEAPKTPDPVTSEPAPATGEPARDAQGRFTAPKEPVAAAPAAPDPAPQATPPAPATPAPEQQHTVPLAKYLDERNDLRGQISARDQQLAALQQRLQAFEKPAQVPDVLQDPEGYAKHIREQLTQDFTAQNDTLRVRMSEQMVLMSPQAGDYPAAKEAFRAAIEQDPYLFERVNASVHPAQEILNWHRQHKLLADIGTDPDAYVRRRFAELTAAGNPPNPAAVQPAPKPAPQIPAPSLGRAPAGPGAGAVPVGSGQAFDALFPG